jgi:V-type H+-transporting ATPase subunit E
VANSSYGGVVMASKDGCIVLDNTLDARLEIVFKHLQPEVWII